MVRRLFVLALAASVVGFYLFSPASAAEKIKIGVLKWTDKEGIPEGVSGLVAQLKSEGFDESKVDFDIQNANGDKEKVTQIAKDLVAKKMDLIFALGTSAAIGVYKETKDIPIVCVIVFDPVGAGLAKSWEHSGTNVTGSSSWVNMDAIVKTLRRVCPAKRIGVLFNETEKNSVIQLEELKKLQDKMSIKVIAANVAKPEEAKEVTLSLVGSVDSIFISGSATVRKGLADILEVTNKSKIPTAGHLPDRAIEGALLAVSANPEKLGVLAAKKAVQVLRGVKPTDIPIEPLGTYDITINLKTAKTMGIDIPVDLLSVATKVIKE